MIQQDPILEAMNGPEATPYHPPTRLERIMGSVQRDYTPGQTRLQRVMSGIKPHAGEYAQEAAGSFAGNALEAIAGTVEAPSALRRKLLNEQTDTVRTADVTLGEAAGEWLRRKAAAMRNEVVERYQPTTLAGKAAKFATRDVAGGLGSTVGMAGGGAVAYGAGIPPWVGVALSGAATNGAAAAYEARSQGATPDQEWTAFALNGLMGTSEALPIAGQLGRILGRADAMSGGWVRHALIEGGEEIAQESTQQLVGNWVARSVAGYDQDRQLLDGLAESGGAAGFSGVIASALASLAGGKIHGGPKGPAAMEPTGTPAQPEGMDLTGGGATFAEQDTGAAPSQGSPPSPTATGAAASGTTRLYRIEPTKGDAPIPTWMESQPEYQAAKQAGGRWFTDDPEEARWYLENEHPGGRIVTLDVPTADVEQYRVSKIKPTGTDNPMAHSRRPEKEFFLPKEIASRASTGTLPGSSVLSELSAANKQDVREVSAPDTPEATYVREFASQRGLKVRFVEGDGPLEVHGAHDRATGTMYVDRRAPLRAVAYHETVHQLGEEADALADDLRKLDPEGSAKYEAAYLARHRQEGLGDPTDLTEEGVAFRAELNAGLVYEALQRPERLRAMLESKPGAWTRIVDAVVRALQKVGVGLRTSKQRALDALRREVAGQDASRALDSETAIRVALRIRDAFDTLQPRVTEASEGMATVENSDALAGSDTPGTAPETREPERGPTEQARATSPAITVAEMPKGRQIGTDLTGQPIYEKEERGPVQRPGTGIPQPKVAQPGIFDEVGGLFEKQAYGTEDLTPPPTPSRKELLANKAVRAEFEALADEAGTEGVGGQIIRGESDNLGSGRGPVIGRTRKIAKAEWWGRRPGDTSPAHVKRAIRKALQGATLTDQEAETVDFLLYEAATRVDPDTYNANTTEAQKERAAIQNPGRNRKVPGVPFSVRPRRLRTDEIATRERVMARDDVASAIRERMGDVSDAAVGRVVGYLDDARRGLPNTNTKAVAERALALWRQDYEEMRGESREAVEVQEDHEIGQALADMVRGHGDIEVQEIVRTIAQQRQPTQRGERLPDVGNVRAKFSVAPRTDSPEFKRFYVGSEISKPGGKPLVVYHGTTHEWTNPHRLWVTDDEEAAAYYADRSAFASHIVDNPDYENVEGELDELYIPGEAPPAGNAVMPLYVNAKKVLDLTDLGDAPNPRELYDHLAELGVVDPTTDEQFEDDILPSLSAGEDTTMWKAIEDWGLDRDAEAKGYDAIKIVDIVSKGLRRVDNHGAWLLLNGAVAKSATGNRGTFDPKNPDIRFSVAPRTDSPEFKRWFGESHVVDGRGKEIVAYHGTGVPDEFNEFNDRAFYGKKGIAGWFAEDPAEASQYAERYGSSRVFPVYLSIKNPATAKGFYVDDLRAKGFDGVLVTPDNRPGHRVWVAFDSSQVKSATGNRGTFDPKNPDIRFSVAPNGSFDLPDDSRSRQFNRALLDSFEALRLTPELDSAISRRPGLAYGRAERVQAQTIRGMIDVAKKVGKEKADQFLYALHAPTRNRIIAERSQGKTGEESNPGSGMTTSEARKIAAEGLKNPDLVRLRDMNRRLNRERLDALEQAGLLSKEQRAEWEKFGPDYVPLRTADDPGSRVAGGSLNVAGPESKRAEGRSTIADSPLSFGVSSFAQAVERAERNKVGQLLAKFVEENPSKQWELVKAEPRTKDGKTTWVTRDLEQGEERLSYKVDGEQRYIYTTNPAIAAAFKQMDVAKATGVLKVAGVFRRYMHNVIIKYNPPFALSNAFRDMGTAAAKVTITDKAATGARVLKNAPAAMLGSWKAIREEGKGGEWGKWYREARDAGALVGWNELVSFQDVEQAISRSKRGAILNAIEQANRGVELGTRVALYEAMRAQGKTQEQAALIARDGTTDFARRGNYSSQLSSLYLFANANLQGTASLWRAVAAHPARGTTVLGALVAMGYLASLASRQLGDGWDDIPDYQKRRMGGVMAGGTLYGVPLPYGFDVFYYLGARAEAAANGRAQEDSLGMDVLEAAIQSFSPVQGADLLQTVTPTIGRPLVEIVTNKDFAGNPIRPQQSPFDRTPSPRSEQTFASVDPTLKAVTQGLNRATGGDSVRPGAIDVSAEDVEHVLKFLGGGLGSNAQRIITAANKWTSGEPVRKSDIPFLRTFMSEVPESAVANLYYDNLAAIEREVEARKKGEEVLDARALALATYARNVDGRVKKLRERMKASPELRPTLEPAMRAAMASLNERLAR